MEILLNIAGLLFGLVGAVLLAVSVRANPYDAHQVVKGKKRYLALIHPERTRAGLTLVALGFLLQFLSAFLYGPPIVLSL